MPSRLSYNESNLNSVNKLLNKHDYSSFANWKTGRLFDTQSPPDKEYVKLNKDNGVFYLWVTSRHHRLI